MDSGSTLGLLLCELSLDEHHLRGRQCHLRGDLVGDGPDAPSLPVFRIANELVVTPLSGAAGAGFGSRNAEILHRPGREERLSLRGGLAFGLEDVREQRPIVVSTRYRSAHDQVALGLDRPEPRLRSARQARPLVRVPALVAGVLTARHAEVERAVERLGHPSRAFVLVRLTREGHGVVQRLTVGEHEVLEALGQDPRPLQRQRPRRVRIERVAGAAPLAVQVGIVEHWRSVVVLAGRASPAQRSWLSVRRSVRPGIMPACTRQRVRRSRELQG